MEESWLSVIDSAVKIGLGSFIAAVSGFLAVSQSQKHEKEKDKAAKIFLQKEERKIKYVEFTRLGHYLTKDHSDTNGVEYDEYVRVYFEIQIIGGDDIRIAASDYFSSVGRYIRAGKINIGREDRKVYIKELNDTLGLFQFHAHNDVGK